MATTDIVYELLRVVVKWSSDKTKTGIVMYYCLLYGLLAHVGLLIGWFSTLGMKQK